MRSKDEDKHQRILDAAVKVFARKGFFQSKVSEIAREAGVADGTIYLYFKNKDDLLISVFEEKMREVNIRVRDVPRHKMDARSRLRAFIRLHLTSFQSDPDLASVLQVELRQSSRFMREYKKVELKRYLDLIGEIIEQGQAEGVFRKNLPIWLVKRLIFGTLDDIVSNWVLSGSGHDLESSAEPLLDLILDGIGSTRQEAGERNPETEKDGKSRGGDNHAKES